MSGLLRAAAERILYWRRNPVEFVRQEFGVTLDPWQGDAVRAFADPSIPLISLQACAGPGKSTVLAWCGWWFISCWGDELEHPKGFCFSVTADNLFANLWPEFAKWQNRSQTGYIKRAFTQNSERIYANDHKATWFLEARTFPKTASPEEQGKTLSGLHGKYVAVLGDETGAIPPAVGRAAEQSLSTGPTFGKVMQAGNPLSRDGMLYDASQSSRWHVIRITSDPDDPKRSSRIPIKWARDMIEAYGRDNPWVQAYILGQFPASAINALLSADEVRAAIDRHPHPTDYETAARVIGVDVAREGDDRSVIFRRQGIVAMPPDILRNVDSLYGAGRVAQHWHDWEADACFIDNTGGFGAGWVDQLRALGRAPVGIHFAGKAGSTRFANKRAEMWFSLAEWVKGGGCLPNVPGLLDELTKPTYTFKGDALILEDKRLIKERLGASTDLADALALTFAAPVIGRAQQHAAAQVELLSRAPKKAYNPFSRF